MVQAHSLTCPPRPLQVLPFVELQRALPSRVADISPSVDHVMRFVNRFIEGFGDVHAGELIEIALREALANAVIHRNHESPDKDVFVTCRCSMDGEVSITVRDQGEGFDTGALPDTTDPNRGMLAHGRGIRIIQACMDEVCFEEGGRGVRMRKRLRRSPR